MSVLSDVAATPRDSSSSTCKIDRSHAVRRLRQNALALLNAHPDAVPLGDDAVVASLAKSEGFDADELAILRVGITGVRHTMVCVPHSVWHAEGRKQALLELKRRANEAQRNCVLVPATFIQREPRLSNSRAISDAAGIDVSAENRMAVLIHLVENGYSTLYDCARVVDHPSPFSCVLNLVALGVVRMDLSKVMSPETRIDLADAA